MSHTIKGSIPWMAPEAPLGTYLSLSLYFLNKKMYICIYIYIYVGRARPVRGVGIRTAAVGSLCNEQRYADVYTKLYLHWCFLSVGEITLGVSSFEQINFKLVGEKTLDPSNKTMAVSLLHHHRYIVNTTLRLRERERDRNSFSKKELKPCYIFDLPRGMKNNIRSCW